MIDNLALPFKLKPFNAFFRLAFSPSFTTVRFTIPVLVETGFTLMEPGVQRQPKTNSELVPELAWV